MKLLLYYWNAIVSVKTEVKDEFGMEVDDAPDVKPDLSTLPPPVSVGQVINENNMFLLQVNNLFYIPHSYCIQ